MNAPTKTKPPAAPARSRGLFGRPPGDLVTLKLIVRRSLKDAKQSLEADNYLRRLLDEVENQDDIAKAYVEIDTYIAQAVDFYLRNRKKEDRVRANKVSCVSATDLTSRQARCIVTVVAWGHMRREIIDLELPQP